MILEGQKLSIGYPDRLVGAGLDVQLETGEVLALLGPNGGGKTTLLKTLLGILSPQAGEVAARHAEPRVDLLAAVVAREPEREPAVGAELRAREAHHAVLHVHVLVFHDDVGRAIPPERVPGPEVRTGEVAFDARPPEGARHHAVELAAAAKRHRAGPRPEGRQDPRHHLVALLPVAADDVKRDAALRAPRRLALERHVGL